MSSGERLLSEAAGSRFPSRFERRRRTWSISTRVEQDPLIGDWVRDLEESSDIYIKLRNVSYVETTTDFSRGRPKGGCQGSLPSMATVEYNMADSQRLEQTMGLNATLDQILAHELGHIYYLLGTVRSSTPEDEAANNREALRWENSQRGQGPFRKVH